MAKSTSIAKITRPRLPDVLSRTRLFRLLEQTRKKSPVIWVSGPAGSGKTTLVSSYLDSRNLPCLWYQVDAGDADSATFFYYLGLAVQKTSRSKRPLPLLTREYQLSIPIFTKRYFEDLFSRLQTPGVVVFDNYQDLGEHENLTIILQEGLALIPDGFFVIIVSRGDPPPALTSLRAKGRMEIIGWDELRFDEEEARGMLKLRLGENLHLDVVRRIHGLTQGWAAGLVLMTERTGSTGDSGPESTTREGVFQYFAEEIFQRIDQSVQDFLLKTVFLPKITASAAETITGLSQADKILTRLVRRNFFTVRRAGLSPTYEYHPLFREFLFGRAEQSYTEEDLRGIRRNAATLLAETGQVEDAARLYLQNSDWEQLIPLVLTNARSLVVQGRSRTLDEWLSGIPDQVADQNPWLLYWQGACKMTADLNESRRCFERAYHRFKAGGDAAGLYLSWAGVVDTYVFEWTDFKPLDFWIEEIEWLLKTYPTYPSPEIEARAAAGIFCALMYRRPDHPDMTLWEERALGIALSANDPYLQLTISSHLILYYSWWNGKQTKAELLVRTLQNTAKSFEFSPFTTIVWKSIEGAYLWMACHFDESVKSLDQAITTAERTGIHLWDAMLFANMAYCSLTQGKYEDADRYLEQMSFVLKTPRKVDISHYHFLRAFESLALGKLQLALQHIHAGMKLSSDAGVPYIYHFYITSHADILIEHGEFKKAEPYLQQARVFGRAMKSLCLEYQYCWLTASIALKSNDRNIAQENLRNYLRISRECRTVNHAWWRSSAMIPLLSEALEAGIEEAHVQELIKLHCLVPTESQMHLENWPWPIRIFTLGQFGIELDGKAVIFGGKTPKKPLELLKAIIALGGREVSEERIIDALWPEAPGDLACKSFEMALQRLRKLIGSDKAIRRQDGLLTLDSAHCWTDVWAFEKLVQDAGQEVRNAEFGMRNGKQKQQSQDRNMKSARIEQFEKAIRLYQGRFLPADTRQSWSALARERLRSKFLRLVTKAGEQYERNGEWKKAVECFERGLERDAVCEEFYQHLMISHSKLGHRSEAVKAYQRCRAALRDGLGLDPSLHTEEIHSSLLRNR